MHFWLLLRPDIRKPIGGVKQMHRLAESLISNGVSATIIQDDKNFHPGWFSSSAPTIAYSEWLRLAQGSVLDRDTNFLVIPETYIPQLQNLAKLLRVIVFNQNGSYTFGLPSSGSLVNPRSVIDLYRSPLVCHVLCVSRHDHRFLSSVLGSDLHAKLSLVVNAIDVDQCRPLPKKKIISYMPRKNSLDSSVVCALLQRQAWFKDWKLVAISNMNHSDVLQLLGQSLAFLSFGHPEGFGLPVAESLACGCSVIGYSGLGGRELFEQSQDSSVCKEVSVGDWQGFVDSVYSYICKFNEDSSRVLRLQTDLSRMTKQRYSQPMMNRSVSNFLESFLPIA